MGKVISFISRKGGTGKTTNAINLATALNELGKKVLLIETDTNYTLTTLRQMELYNEGLQEGDAFEIIGSLDDKIPEEIDAIKRRRLDYIIVDSAGKTTDEGIKKLAIKSDAIVVPTSLSQNDLLVTFQTVTDLKPAQEINPDLKLMVLPNRIHSLTGHNTIFDNLRSLEAIILGVRVPQKNLFVNFSTIKSEKEYLDIAKNIIDQI